MGFRDMRLFNQALLARQAWRLIQFPDTLCTQILKAKYYPNGFLTDTVFSGNASSTWHAIEYGLELLKQGVIWRVGNGASIRAWRDPWIPRESNHLSISNQGCCCYRWVADYLLPNGAWNEQRLGQFFHEDDVVEILKIKASSRSEGDFIAWYPEKLGIFTVKSAYRLGLSKQLQQQDRGASSARPDGARPAWRTIWKCPVPPKVKILVWKICSNAIATQQSMLRRHMTTHGTCTICGMEEEDTFHVFMRCPHARQLWLAMKEVWPLPEDSKLKHTGTEWLLSLLQNIDEKQRAPILLTLWRIWHAHNEMTHAKPCPPIEGSRRFLISYMNSLLLIKQFPSADIAKGKMVLDPEQGFRTAEGEKMEKQQTRQWTRPPPGTVKLNVDGSFTQTGMGIGMILREHNGETVFTACRSLDQCDGALQAELLAIEEGVKLAMNWSTLNIVVETDCADAVGLIIGKQPNISTYAFIVMAIKRLLRERDVTLVKIPRGCNSISHDLAQLGRTQCRTGFWLRDFPQEVFITITNDCNPCASA
jgi:hypothetical protein